MLGFIMLLATAVLCKFTCKRVDTPAQPLVVDAQWRPCDRRREEEVGRMPASFSFPQFLVVGGAAWLIRLKMGKTVRIL